MNVKDVLKKTRFCFFTVRIFVFLLVCDTEKENCLKLTSKNKHVSDSNVQGVARCILILTKPHKNNPVFSQKSV